MRYIVGLLLILVIACMLPVGEILGAEVVDVIARVNASEFMEVQTHDVSPPFCIINVNEKREVCKDSRKIYNYNRFSIRQEAWQNILEVNYILKCPYFH